MYNPLILLICIAEYDEQDNNLVGVKNDLQSLQNLWYDIHYTVCLLS